MAGRSAASPFAHKRTDGAFVGRTFVCLFLCLCVIFVAIVLIWCLRQFVLKLVVFSTCLLLGWSLVSTGFSSDFGLSAFYFLPMRFAGSLGLFTF